MTKPGPLNVSTMTHTTILGLPYQYRIDLRQLATKIDVGGQQAGSIVGARYAPVEGDHILRGEITSVAANKTAKPGQTINQKDFANQLQLKVASEGDTRVQVKVFSTGSISTTGAKSTEEANAAVAAVHAKIYETGIPVSGFSPIDLRNSLSNGFFGVEDRVWDVDKLFSVFQQGTFPTIRACSMKRRGRAAIIEVGDVVEGTNHAPRCIIHPSGCIQIMGKVEAEVATTVYHTVCDALLNFLKSYQGATVTKAQLASRAAITAETATPNVGGAATTSSYTDMEVATIITNRPPKATKARGGGGAAAAAAAGRTKRGKGAAAAAAAAGGAGSDGEDGENELEIDSGGSDAENDGAKPVAKAVSKRASAARGRGRGRTSSSASTAANAAAAADVDAETETVTITTTTTRSGRQVTVRTPTPASVGAPTSSGRRSGRASPALSSGHQLHLVQDNLPASAAAAAAAESSSTSLLGIDHSGSGAAGDEGLKGQQQHCRRPPVARNLRKAINNSSSNKENIDDGDEGFDEDQEEERRLNAEVAAEIDQSNRRGRIIRPVARRGRGGGGGGGGDRHRSMLKHEDNNSGEEDNDNNDNNNNNNNHSDEEGGSGSSKKVTRRRRASFSGTASEEVSEIINSRPMKNSRRDYTSSPVTSTTATATAVAVAGGVAGSSSHIVYSPYLPFGQKQQQQQFFSPIGGAESSSIKEECLEGANTLLMFARTCQQTPPTVGRALAPEMLRTVVATRPVSAPPVFHNN